MKTTAEMIAVMQAYIHGKKIECKLKNELVMITMIIIGIVLLFASILLPRTMLTT